MFNICRLCLCTSNDLNKELFANVELLRKISLCLHVDFVINDSLPQQVCSCCLDKLEEILQFHEKVKSNQQLLISYLELGEESLTSFYCSLDADIKEEKKVFEELDAVKPELTSEISESNDLVENDYSSDDNVTLSSIKNTKKRKYKNGTKNLIRERPEKGGSELNIEISTNVDDITYIAEDDTSPMCLRTRIKKGKRQNASLNLSQSKKKKVRKLDSEAQASNVNKKNCEAQENIHSSSALNDKIYKCLTCFEPFNGKKLLREHYKLKHQPVVQESDVDECIAIHGTKFKCTKCEKVYESKKRADYHVLIAHLYKNRPFLCKLCGKTFKEIPNIVLHARAHDQSTRMACSYKCGYTTNNSYNLKLHETNRHKNDYKFTCKKCGKGFIQKSLLEEHNNIHTGHKPFVCELCGIAYSLNKSLANHRLKVHSEISDVKRSKSWHCLHCPRLLDSKYALKEHLSKEHGIKTVYQCDTCGKTFLRNCNLTAHVKFTHEKIRPHICSICKKDFNSRSKMKRHETLHNGIKSQVCLTCGKTYTQSYALNLHITKLAKPNQSCQSETCWFEGDSHPLNVDDIVVFTDDESSDVLTSGEDDDKDDDAMNDCFHLKV